MHVLLSGCTVCVYIGVECELGRVLALAELYMCMTKVAAQPACHTNYFLLHSEELHVGSGECILSATSKGKMPFFY